MRLNAGPNILYEIKVKTKQFQVNFQPMALRVFVLSETKIIEAANVEGHRI